jgi:leucine dehydrogenase
MLIKMSHLQGVNSPVNHPDFDGHENVVMVDDQASGLAGIICIHSTTLGAAAGGCRRAVYETPAAALTDALRLSQGMSYKNALAGLPAGGGKAVLYKMGAESSRESAWAAFADAVNSLHGRYITAEDVGTTVADMQIVARRSRYVAGLPNRPGRAGGDPSPWTALGVFVALQVSAGRPLAGARVAVQGLGAVGYKLCERLHHAGARLVVSDVDRNRTFRAARDFGAETVAPERIHAVSADIFSPNALGAVLNSQTISELGSPVVCGGANNQLESPQSGRELLKREVTYAPDYVVNAGGIINVMAEYLGEAAERVESRVLGIGERVNCVLEQARTERRPSNEVSDDWARALIDRSSSRTARTGIAGALT